MAEHEEHERDKMYEDKSPKELALATIAALQAQVREMDAEEEKARLKNTPQPDGRHYKWTVSVAYKDSKARADGPYEYLILRSPKGGYYTTGTTKRDMYYPSWEALMAWLHSDRVQWHSPMRPLVVPIGVRPAVEAWGVR